MAINADTLLSGIGIMSSGNRGKTSYSKTAGLMDVNADELLTMQIDTPQGSHFGSDDDAVVNQIDAALKGCASSKSRNVSTQYQFPWSNSNREKIRVHKRYLEEEYKRVDQLDQCGPTREPWPKKPKFDITTLDGAKARNVKTVLSGEELHQYLVVNCVRSDTVVMPQTPDGGFTSLEMMTGHLKAGYSNLRKARNAILGSHIDYGHALNTAFAQHELEKDSGKTKTTWEVWLKDNIGISAPFGRKLRAIATLLQPYPRFRLLSLSFSEIYSRQKEIKIMLSADHKPWPAYWRG